MLDLTEIRQLLPNVIEASEQRCVAAGHSVRQTFDLAALTREAIARSRDQLARLNLENPNPD